MRGEQEDKRGQAPSAEVLTSALRARHPLPASTEALNVKVDPARDALELNLRAEGHVYRLEVRYQSGAEREDRWPLMVDALDSLLGRFVESGFSTRSVPQGPNVEFQGAQLIVRLDHSVPELEALADALLAQDGVESKH